MTRAAAALLNERAQGYTSGGQRTPKLVLEVPEASRVEAQTLQRPTVFKYRLYYNSADGRAMINMIMRPVKAITGISTVRSIIISLKASKSGSRISFGTPINCARDGSSEKSSIGKRNTAEPELALRGGRNFNGNWLRMACTALNPPAQEPPPRSESEHHS